MMITNATWTTSHGHQVRVTASEPSKGFVTIIGQGGWTALVPASQVARDDEHKPCGCYNNDPWCPPAHAEYNAKEGAKR